MHSDTRKPSSKDYPTPGSLLHVKNSKKYDTQGPVPKKGRGDWSNPIDFLLYRSPKAQRGHGTHPSS